MLFSYKKTIGIFIFCLLFGVICGTFVFNCLTNESKNSLIIYYNYLTGKINFNDVNKWDYFIYIFFYRIKGIILVTILGLTSYRVVFHAGFMWCMGVKNSILIAALTIVKGSGALLWYIVLTQPHMAIYIYIIYLVIKKMDFRNAEKRKKSQIKDIVTIILLTILVSFLESTLNILILSNFI